MTNTDFLKTQIADMKEVIRPLGQMRLKLYELAHRPCPEGMVEQRNKLWLLADKINEVLTQAAEIESAYNAELGENDTAWAEMLTSPVEKSK